MRHVIKGKFKFYPKWKKTILSEGSWEAYNFSEEGDAYKREGKWGVSGECETPELLQGKESYTSFEHFEERNVPDKSVTE